MQNISKYYTFCIFALINLNFDILKIIYFNTVVLKYNFFVNVL